MPRTAADLQTHRSPLFPELGINRLQRLNPDPIPPRACPRTRDADGRFAKGCSGNPRGRPRGIRNPRRRPLGLLLRQARPGTLVPLTERKRYLLLPLLRLVLPPARPIDPAKRLGIDFSRIHTAQEIAAMLNTVLDAVCRGEITPGDGARLARRARKPLRTIGRSLWRDLARLKAACRAETGSGKYLLFFLKFPVLREFRLRPPRLRARPQGRPATRALILPCSTLFPRDRIQQNQRLGPVLASRRTARARAVLRDSRSGAR